MSIYLDYQASTPVAPEVRAAMRPWNEEKCANPHSPHKAGREAAAAVELARESVGALMPPDGKVYFTSGATESLNWALRCAGSGPIAFPDTEHAAVRDTALWLKAHRRRVVTLPVGRDGLVGANMELPTGLGVLAVMLVNNEIGVIQPVAALAKAAKAEGALVVCDAVQGFGRIPVPHDPDLIAVSAHKIHGPKGIGALWVRDGVEIEPLLYGGAQEGGLRSGTLSPALCAGFGVAANLARQRMEDDAHHVSRLWTMAMNMLPRDWTVNGSTSHRHLGNLNMRREGLDASRLISELREVAFSAGSACASGSGRPSHVLSAIGLNDGEAKSSIRLGFGRYTTASDLRDALRLIFAAADRQWKMAA